MIYGYIRVSTREQNEDRQLIALREMAVLENFHAVYQRWKSGEITGTAAAKECEMPLSTFRYRAEIYQKARLS